MIRSILASAACAALCLSAAPVAAEPFQSFLDLCMEGNADSGFAVSSAGKAGWFAMPQEAVDGMGTEFRDPAVLTNFNPEGHAFPESPEILLTGWGSGQDVFDISGVRLDVCIVATPQMNQGELRSRIDSLLGFESIEVQGERAWVFSRQGSGFRNEAAVLDLTDDELPAYLLRRKLYIVGLLDENDMTGLMLGAVRPE